MPHWLRSAAGHCVIAAMLILAAAAPAWAAASQRMVIATGCYVLPPGKDGEMTAYCLDQMLPAPGPGAVLSQAPASFGDAVVRIDDGAPMPLQAALAAHVIQIEGTGDPLSVKIRNLTQRRVQICITAPTVVAEGGPGSSGDLAKKYDQVVAILARGAAPDSATRAKLQQQVWDAVKKVDDAAAEERVGKAIDESMRRLFLRTPASRPPPPTPEAPPGRADCDVPSNAFALCVGRK